MVEDFVKADRMRQERANNESWLQGMYFYDGLCCALHNAFSKKGTSKAEYPKEPYQIFKHEKTEQEKQAEAEREREKAVKYFNSLVKAGKRKKEIEAKQSHD